MSPHSPNDLSLMGSGSFRPIFDPIPEESSSAGSSTASSGRRSIVPSSHRQRSSSVRNKQTQQHEGDATIRPPRPSRARRFQHRDNLLQRTTDIRSRHPPPPPPRHVPPPDTSPRRRRRFKHRPRHRSSDRRRDSRDDHHTDDDDDDDDDDSGDSETESEAQSIIESRTGNEDDDDDDTLTDKDRTESKQQQKENDGRDDGDDDDSSTLFSEALQMSTTSAQSRIQTLVRWGIPIPFQYTPPELILQERLIWVRYTYGKKASSSTQQKESAMGCTAATTQPDFYWWPAILYLNYGEIQSTRLWPQISVTQRVPLAMMTAFSPHAQRAKCRVARLLGRRSVELLEVEHAALQTVSFAWELPHQLRNVACKLDAFHRHPSLYYDWHAAMDQVEALMWEFMGHKLNLSGSSVITEDSSVVATTSRHLPSGRLTWMERARQAEQQRWKQQHPGMMRWFNCSCTDDLEIPASISDGDSVEDSIKEQQCRA